MVNKSSDKEIDGLFGSENYRNVRRVIASYIAAVTACEEDYEKETIKLEETFKASLYYAKPDQVKENSTPEFLLRLNEAVKGQPFRYPDIEYYPHEDSPIQ